VKKYRKLVAAAVGILAMVLGPQFLGITPADQFFGIGQEAIVTAVIGVLTALGVWGARNDAE
jgi:predicted RND superfamily exporter protein